MSSVDWDASATLQQRDDAGSDMFYEFTTLGTGRLADMVDQVMQMSPEGRARIVLDVQGIGVLDSGQVAELSRRADRPTR